MEENHMTNIKQMDPIDLAASFVDFYNVEGIFAAYDEWQSDSEAIKKKIIKIQQKLDAGGLTRKIRSKKVAERDTLIDTLKTEDPRLVPASRFEDWLTIMGVEKAELKSVASWAYNTLDKALDDTDAYKISGLPPFKLMRTDSGKYGYHKVMSYRDYGIHEVTELAKKDDRRLDRKRRQIQQIILRVQDHYDEIPAEIEAAVDQVDMLFEFQRRVAGIFDEMLVQRVAQISGPERTALQVENAFESLEEEAECTFDKAAA
jgi:hypothetical protein